MKEDKLIRTWTSRRMLAASTQTPMYRKFKEYYDLVLAVAKTIQAPWRSKLFLPEFFSVIMTKAAILTSKPLGWEIVGRTEDDKVNAEPMKQVMDYQLREPHVAPSPYNRYTTMVLDSLITGTSIAKVNFRFLKESYRQYPIDEKTGKIDTSKVEVLQKMARWNEFEPVESIRFFIDPVTKSIQQAQWIIEESFQTLAQLKAQNLVSPGYYTNLSELTDGDSSADDLGQYNTSRNNLINLSDKMSQDDTVKYLRIWNCYERKYDDKTGEPFVEKSVVAAEKVFIKEPARQEEWHNQYPFVVMYDYNRPHEFWGIGEVEVNQSVVRGINDNLNHFMDNENLSNNTMIMRRSSTSLEPFIIEPGGEVVYDGEAPTQFRFPDPNGQSFQIVHQTLTQGLERSTGVTGYLAGMPSTGVDKTRGTKGGIQTITQNAQNRVGYNQRQGGDFMEQVGRMFLANCQQFFTEDFYVRLSDGTYTKRSPEEIRGEFDLFATDASLTPSNKEEEVSMIMEMLDRLEASMPILNSEGKTIKVSKLLTRYLNIIGERMPEDIIVEMPPVQPPSEVKKNISINFSGDILPGPIKSEILASEFGESMPEELPEEMGPEGMPPEGMPEEMPQEMPQEMPEAQGQNQMPPELAAIMNQAGPPPQ